MEAFSWEKLSEHLSIAVSKNHKFGTDAFLLSDFAAPRRKDAVCDFCAGCGIVGALWFRQPENAPKLVVSVEIASMAVAQMRKTCEKNPCLANRFVPVEGDLCRTELLRSFAPFDVITCNPPYKAQGHGIPSRQASDLAARHEMFCTFSEICQSAAALLTFEGRFCVCLRPERTAEAILTMNEHHLTPKRMRFVAKQPGNAPWLVLLEGRLRGNHHMTVLPTLFMEKGNGFSQEVLRIYQKTEAHPIKESR